MRAECLRLPGVEAKKRNSQRFSEVPDGGNGGTGTDFDNGQSGTALPPCLPSERLFPGACRVPSPIAKHENVGSGEAATGRAAGKLGMKADPLGIDLGNKAVGGPDESPAVVEALQVMDRSVAFQDPVLGVSGFGKLSVDVAGEDEDPSGDPGGDPEEEGEAVMGTGLPINGEPVPIESPGQSRIPFEALGGGHLFKGEAGLSQGRIGLPEALGAPKVRKPGVNSHAGTRRQDNPVDIVKQ